MLWPNLVERYPIELALKVLTCNNKYKTEEDMFVNLDEELAAEEINRIDPLSNIIISTQTDQRIIRRNMDGSISIKTDMDINISGSRIVNNLAVIEFYPQIKFSIPRGILPVFKAPRASSYHNHIYEYMTLIEKKNTDDEIPNFILFQDVRFTVYSDLDQLKRSCGTLFLKKGTDMVSVYFQPVYYVGNHIFPNLDRIYWLKNSEILKTFDEVL